VINIYNNRWRVFYTFKIKSLYKVLVSLALVVALTACIFMISNSTIMTSGESRKLPVYRVDTGDQKVVALSFDAAWGADKTQGIIDILNKYNIKATFFLVGFWVDKYDNEVKKLAENGFDIGNHSHNHLKMSTLQSKAIVEEIEYVNKKVETLTGKRPYVFRAPFGDYNNRLIENVTNLKMQAVQWSIDTLDWKGLGADEILNRVKSKASYGDIILFHNNSDHVLDALPKVIEYLLEKGYSFQTVSELVYKNGFNIDVNGVQHKEK
ncbi:MAG: polysaccharide deacetylase family protein, partial [Clostridia bacterium]|nr:polysaccharide deacetylase family protein [Clostridia bacterium]